MFLNLLLAILIRVAPLAIIVFLLIRIIKALKEKKD